MITIPQPKYRKRRRTRLPKNATPAATGPVLVAATLEVSADPLVLLTFDRAIDVTGIVPAQITVDDAAGTGYAYAGYDVDSQPTAESVAVLLAETGAAEGPTVLNATGATGIVADADDVAWAGVTDLELPFP